MYLYAVEWCSQWPGRKRWYYNMGRHINNNEVVSLKNPRTNTVDQKPLRRWVPKERRWARTVALVKWTARTEHFDSVNGAWGLAWCMEWQYRNSEWQQRRISSTFGGRSCQLKGYLLLESQVGLVYSGVAATWATTWCPNMSWKRIYRRIR
jgi:hypothetical protein